MQPQPQPMAGAPPASAGTPLRDLWRRRLDTLISGIANRDTYYLQIANAAEHLSAEYHGRFLIELLQNANDQAVREGLTNSLVMIHRTADLLAVGNKGQPFDNRKIDAITSIFQSDKAADECIGNKGIGFKAVFQVADSAEVFSSGPGSNLEESCATGIRIVRKPFEDEDFRAYIRGIANELLESNYDRLRAIDARFTGEIALDAVLREAGRAAWFTFPLPCSKEHLRSRILELGISTEQLRATQTLIVLPLDDASRLRGDVDSAIDEICGAGGGSRGEQTGASFLFLPGIGEITVVDHVRRFRADLKKSAAAPAETLTGGVTLRRQRATQWVFDLAPSAPAPAPVAKIQDWWVAERLIGGGEGERAAQERGAIREAIQTLRLPEENWRGIEKVPVAVAMPAQAGGNEKRARQLGPTGMFCIGLPTLVPTGLPLWVSAHFHGKIDRTAIDFENAYNRLLFDAAAELCGSLLQRLKRDPETGARRLVTLAMERGIGELAATFYGDHGIARTQIVLGDDGSFLKGSELRLPRAADLPMFLRLVDGAGGAAGYGFRLPDPALLADAREILDDLAQNITADDALYLRRASGGRSLLEHAAATHRKEGQSFWEPFLTFVLERFGTEQADALAEQVILPSGRSELTSAKSRTFFPPMRLAGQLADNGDHPQSIDDSGEELAAIDETVSAMLKFFDDTAVTVRTGTARDYTPLAQKLAPDAGRGLVRRPRQEDLINDALIPAMRESRGDNDRMLALLRQALLWLVGTPPKSKQRINTEALLVPVGGSGNAWSWVEASGAYLGAGWDTDHAISLLTTAFGSRPGKQLIAWDRFEKRARQHFKEVDRRWWLERIKDIGVASSPRIIKTPRPIAVAASWSYTHLSPHISLPCPLPCPDGLWQSYLTIIARRSSSTKTGQPFYLNEVAWIDGLETDSVRAAVVEAMLRKPGRYDRHVRAKLSRHSGEDKTEVPALWVYALCAGKWPTIPTSRGLSAPSQSWFLPLESREARGDRFTFLPCVKGEFSGARDLLKGLGVVAVDEAHIPRLAKALQEIAGHVEAASFEEARQIDALASDLYEAIERRLEGGESANGVGKLLEAPIPLFKGERIGHARLQDVAQLWIEDDPIRRRHIQGFTDCWVIPKRFLHTYPHLVAALRGILGSDRIVRVSEAPIDIRFSPLEDGTILLDYLRDEFPDRPLAEDLGLLILKGGGQAVSPHDEAFREAWRRIARTRVVRGRFEGAMAVAACFDAQRDGGPALMVDSSLTPHEIVAETWQLVGPSYRPIWGAYSQSLAGQMAERFFQDYGVSSAERMEVRSAIGLGFEQRLRRYLPVCLALWRRANPDRPCDDFHGKWNQHARTPEPAAEWLAWEGLRAHIELAARLEEPKGSLALLRSLGLTVAAWQKARQELGEAPWRFASSERIYEAARDALAGHVMALFAYLVVPRASGSSGLTVPAELAEPAAAWAERIRATAVPTDVAGEDLPAAALIARAAQDAAGCAGEQLSTAEAAVLVEPVRNLGTAALSGVTAIKLKDEPDKAATVYERYDVATRAREAAATMEDIVKVTAALASKHGEELKDGAVRDHAQVALLSHGTWANRVSVLAAVRYALESLVPATARRMKDRQAFRDFDDWRALWRKFEELGSLPAPVKTPVAKRTFAVAGAGWTQDAFAASAAQGPTGAVAQRLAAAVNPNIDVAAMSAVTRAKVQVAVTTPGIGIGGGAGGSRWTPDEYLTMLGAAGEYFVYEQLKAICRDFDATNWLSNAKEAFGYSQGDDSLGYDFAYEDVGELFVRPLALSRRCLIEVKSSAQGGGNSFEMSMNEWEVARRCHQEPNLGTYVIIRVADITATPRLTDILVDPVGLHLQGALNYTSRDLLVILGKAN